MSSPSPSLAGLGRPLTVALAAVLLVAACSPGETTSPTGSPPSSPDPTATPVVGAIDHATGPDDLILRFEEGGGFVPPGFLVTQTPIFSLYGDGTVIMRNDRVDEPPPDAGDGVIRDRPLRIGKLTEEQVQGVLEFALDDGRLGIAAGRYDNPFVADAPTAVFTIQAGGVSKTVEVVALGMVDDLNLPDPDTRRALAELGDQLRQFDALSSVEFRDWSPDRYRGILLDDAGPVQGGAAPIDWPWSDIAPADFVSPPENEFSYPRRVLSTVEVALIGLEGLDGGAQGIVLVDTEGRRHSMALRVLLPDEAS